MTLGGEDESSELHHYRGAVSWLEKRFNFTFMDTKHTRKLTERLDIRVDWALSQVEDNAHYHKYIVITSQTSRLFTKR